MAHMDLQVESGVSALGGSPPNSNILPYQNDRFSTRTSPPAYGSVYNENNEDDSDLGELVTGNGQNSPQQSDAPTLSGNDSDDSDMAREIEAAGEVESLIGSDNSSDDEHLANEEQYMIEEELHRANPNEHDGSKHQQASNVQQNVFGDDYDYWDSFSPANGSAEDDDVIANELFKPQRGFASSPEPLFSDFYGSSIDSDQDGSSDFENEKNDNHGDGIHIYGSSPSSDDDETSSDNDASISDMEPMSMPLIAHVGATQGVDVDDADRESGDDDGEAGEQALKNAMPLLVIEDLDGRLVYARAGDGEAVFGSDGEFEFEGESDEESSDDEIPLLSPSKESTPHPHPEDSHVSDCDIPDIDDGETTDELPDNDMPYPRLLVGSIAPHGGRNARRAREIAARSRNNSPRVSSRAPSPTTIGLSARKAPSTLSNVLSVNDHDNDNSSSESVQAVDEQNAHGKEAHLKRPQITQDLYNMSPEHLKPPMGQFMPTCSKSVHRAVIDGSNRAPSPFSTSHHMQRATRRKRSRFQPDEDSFDQVVSSYPSSRKRRNSDAFNTLQHNCVPARPIDSNGSPESLPEPLEQDSAGPMDLSDVLDEGLLWQGSSDGDSTHDDAASDFRQNKPRLQNAPMPDKTYDRAIARWTRIPMGAFRSAQQYGVSTNPSTMSDAYWTHQRPSSSFLITQAMRNPRQAFDRSHTSTYGTPHQTHTPFRWSVTTLQNPRNPVSPLHRTLADAAISDLTSKSEQSRKEKYRQHRLGRKLGEHAVIGGNFVVSPVLRPVKHRQQKSDLNGINSLTSPLLAIGDAAPSDHSPLNNAHIRKVAKHEKRDRLARQEVIRRQ